MDKLYNCVLVIDDSRIDLYVAEQSIKKYSKAKEVVLKDSAHAGLEYLIFQFIYKPDKLPQVIFLDILMPDMDGFAFLTEYQKLPDEIHQRCKVVMLTSSEDPYDRKRASINPMVEGYICKPLGKESLQT